MVEDNNLFLALIEDLARRGLPSFIWGQASQNGQSSLGVGEKEFGDMKKMKFILKNCWVVERE